MSSFLRFLYELLELRIPNNRRSLHYGYYILLLPYSAMDNSGLKRDISQFLKWYICNLDNTSICTFFFVFFFFFLWFQRIKMISFKIWLQMQHWVWLTSSNIALNFSKFGVFLSAFFLIQTKISGSFCSNAENYGPGKTRDIFDTVKVDAICLT